VTAPGGSPSLADPGGSSGQGVGGHMATHPCPPATPRLGVQQLLSCRSPLPAWQCWASCIAWCRGFAEPPAPALAEDGWGRCWLTLDLDPALLAPLVGPGPEEVCAVVW